MFGAIKNFIRFRLAQNIGRTTARKLGLGSLAVPMGLYAGYRALRRR